MRWEDTRRVTNTDDAMILQEMIAQCVDDSGRWFPGKAQSLPNLVLCLAGEVGEVANLVKKNVRGSLSSTAMMEELPEEVIDVLIYLCNLMGHETFQHVDWNAIWSAKRQYNESRFGLKCITPDQNAREAFEREHFK